MNETNWINIIITSVLSSSLASTIILYFSKKYFDKKIQYHFDKKLEIIKNELAVELGVKKDILKARVDGYGKIGEKVYHARNGCRDLLEKLNKNNISDFNSKNIENDIEEVKDILVKYRTYFENSIFDEAHRFKNNLVKFYQILGDMEFYANREEADKILNILEQLNDSYSQIDAGYKTIIKSLGFADVTSHY